MSTDDPTLQLPSQPPRDAVPTTAETTAPTTADSPAAGSPATSPQTTPASTVTGTSTATGTGAPRHRLRVGTAVWGLVIAAIGAGILAVSLGAEIDLELATILLLGFAGVAMLVGSIVGGVRRERDRGRDRP